MTGANSHRPPLQGLALAPGVTVDRIRIGRVVFEGVHIKTREGAINFQEMLDDAYRRTQRARVARLPSGAPAQKLSVEIANHLRDKERRNLRQKSIDGTARTLKLLLLACGDIPVSRIDPHHIQTLWELLRWAPIGLTQSPELQSMSVEELIALGKEANVPAPAWRTLELHRRFLSTFFSDLVLTRAIGASPMALFKPVKEELMQVEDSAARMFTDEDLQRIFDPKTFEPWARRYPHRWWAPILGLYTGARINEIAQLKLADIVKERGIWCIAIRRTADADLVAEGKRLRSRQALKGRAAVRTIPLHPCLLGAGFLTFVEDMRQFGHPRLFPHLSAGTNRKTGETHARYSRALLNQFGRYLRGLGFPKGLGFHGFRHTLATDLDQQGVRVEDVALLTGHSVSKRVPVLQDHYIHKKPEHIRARQQATLAVYQPSVTVPIYTQGQFDDSLRAKRLHF